MNKDIKNKAIVNRKNKISFLYILIFLTMSFFLFSVLKTITSDRRVPSNTSTIHDRSFRGAIISADGYTLSDSQKTYQAVIRGSSIKPDKKPLFVKLFSIYSGIPEKEILKKFKNRKGKKIQGNIVISKTIHARSAMQLKSLSYKLRKLGVFRSIKNRNGIRVVYGLDIIENGESRRFPLGEILSPIIGYVGDKSDGRYTRPSGKKGLERSYDKHIAKKQDGFIRGKRDVVGALIHDKNTKILPRVDGLDLHLNIPLDVQSRVEIMLDQMRQSIDADEIIVGVMESETGKVLSLATSNRYNPAHIRQEDISALVPKFTEYPYEAGSVLKPLTVAIALEHKKVSPNTLLDTHNGRLQIGKRHWITDDHKYESLTVSDIVVHSSNVGTSKIAWMLTGRQFREGLLKFGLAKPSGVDLSRDLPGMLKSVRKLDHKLHKANTSYGYGMMATHAQLMKAYAAFNNGGTIITPRIVNYLKDVKGNRYKLGPKTPDSRAISKKTANQIHNILIEVVNSGTGVKAQYPGLIVGGKTGTSHIAKGGRYVREYHSGFYGFANDVEGNKYTIGVLVIRAKKYRHYFASKSAVPTFRRILDILVELEYLKPEGIPEVSPKIEIEQPTPTTPAKKKASLESTNTTQSTINVSKQKHVQKKLKQAKPNTPIPRVQPQVAPKNKSVNELFEDLF